MTSDSVISQKLAIDGGPKAATNKRVGWPQFAEEGIKAVEQVLRSGKVNYWTGPKGMEFEKRFAQWQGSKFAISTATGTSALHVALSALGIGPGDEVIVPSYTFIATSFAVVQAGAIPRFADVNLEDHCLSVESAEKLVTKRTKAVMPVHLYGNVCDMDKINAFARKHNLFVIEDNAEAFGGSYKGKKTGTLSHIAGLSFCQNKTFTTGGEGGMVTTDDEDLAWEARSFRDHGYDVKERLNLLELEQKLRRQGTTRRGVGGPGVEGPGPPGRHGERRAAPRPGHGPDRLRQERRGGPRAGQPREAHDALPRL